MSSGIIIQARLGSTRLPNKVLLPIGGIPVIKYMTDNILHGLYPEIKFIFAIPDNKENDFLCNYINEYCYHSGKVSIYRGSEHNVLERVCGAANYFSIDTIIDITADCPFVNSELINVAFDNYVKLPLNYYSNCLPERKVPDGFDIQIYETYLLEECLMSGTANPEHTGFNVSKMINITKGQQEKSIHHDKRITLDTIEDLHVINEIAKVFNRPYQIQEMYKYLDTHQLSNSHIKPKAIK